MGRTGTRRARLALSLLLAGGLVLVLGAVERWGGRVTVASEPERGTTFRVFLSRLPG